MTPLEQAKERVTIYALAAKFFPGWRPGKSCRSPFRDEKNDSFSVSEDGRLFNDFAEGAGGDQVAFLARALGLSMSDAAKKYIELAGIDPRAGGAWRQAPTPRPQPQPAREAYTPRPMPPDVSEAWREGCQFLRDDPEQAERLGAWRGWTPAFVRQLADESRLGLPRWRGRRVVGWQVDAPAARDGGTIPIGVHLRLPANEAGGRATWIFWPNSKTHGEGWRVPSFPVVWGRVATARLVVIAEGQWDAASFGLAAGWFDSDEAWPADVALVGIRGAQGQRPFLDGWSSHWPDAARCVLVCDADVAGSSWFQRKGDSPSFAEKLAARCIRVQVLKPAGEGVKDANDALRAGTLTAASIRNAFRKMGVVNDAGRIQA